MNIPDPTAVMDSPEHVLVPADAGIDRILLDAEHGVMTDDDYTRLWLFVQDPDASSALKNRAGAALQVADDRRWFQERLELAYCNR